MGCYGIAFHRGHALCATGDLGGVGRVWDLRSGKSIYLLQGHVKGVIDIDFSPDGHTIATSSDDHTVRIWDLRKKDCVYTLPAHSRLISCCKFAPVSGEFLLTASYDKTCKLWSTRDWSLLAEMAGHEGFVMGAAITQD